MVGLVILDHEFPELPERRRAEDEHLVLREGAHPVLADLGALLPASRHDSPLLAPTLDKLAEIGPLPEEFTVHLDAGYDSGKTREELKAAA
jgi:hypothetical protein